MNKFRITYPNNHIVRDDTSRTTKRAHIYQQKVMGSFNFYKRTLYEYLINPGYSPQLYTNPTSLEYWADQYMFLTR